MGLEIIILNEVSQRQTSYNIAYIWNLKIQYKQIYLQNRNSATNVENKFMVKKGQRGGGRDKLGVWD